MRNALAFMLACLILAGASVGGRAQTVVPEDVALDVSATSTWTQALLYVIAGDTLFICAGGSIGPGSDSIDWRGWSGPEGVNRPQAGGCSDCPLPGYPLRCLIARIGEGQPFVIGLFAAVVANSSGALYVGINEDSPDQNVGAMRAFIWRRGGILTAVEDRTSTPMPFVELCQNFPNPFNPTTTIRFSLPKPARASIEIFNVSGQLVVKLFDRMLPEGEHSVTWTGIDGRGVRAASGIYFYRLRAGDYVGNRKMVLLR